MGAEPFHPVDNEVVRDAQLRFREANEDHGSFSDESKAALDKLIAASLASLIVHVLLKLDQDQP